MSDNQIFDETVKLPNIKCPYCFFDCNAALPLAENGKRQQPAVNNLLVCASCVKVSRFNNSLMLVRIPDSQLQAILGNNPTIAKQVLDLQMAAQKILKRIPVAKRIN